MRPESLARSGILSLVGSAFAALAALGLTALIGRGFGPEGTGVFFQGVAIFTVASQVLRLGTNSAIVRFTASQRALTGVSDSWRIIIVSCLPVAIVAILVGASFALFSAPLAAILAPIEQRDDLQQLLIQMPIFIAAGAIVSVLQTVLRMVAGVGAFTLLQSILLPLSRLVATAVVVALALTARDAFLWWMLVLPAWLLVTVVVLIAPLRREKRDRGSTAAPRVGFGEFWAFSGPRAVGSALETGLDWSDVLIVAALTSPTQAGIYAVATRAVRAGQIVDRAMRIAVSPRISALLAVGDLGTATRLHTAVARLMILTAWPFYLTLALLGPAVLALFGAGFTVGAPALAILAIAMMVSAASGMLQSVLLQGGRSSWQMYNKAVVLGCNILLTLLLVPVIGISGAAVSWVVSLALDTGIAAWQVHRLIGVRLQPRSLLFAAAVPLVVFGVGCTATRILAGDSLLGLAVGLPVTLIAYAVVVWTLRRRLGIHDALDGVVRAVPGVRSIPFLRAAHSGSTKSAPHAAEHTPGP